MNLGAEHKAATIRTKILHDKLAFLFPDESIILFSIL